MKTDTYTPTKIETWPVQYEAVKAWRETKKRQCYGSLRNNEGAVCAMGLLLDEPMRVMKEIDREHRRRDCPRCELWVQSGGTMVVHWNNDHKFTFKEIADLAEAYPHLVFTEAS